MLVLSGGRLYVVDEDLVKPARKVGGFKGVGAVAPRVLSGAVAESLGAEGGGGDGGSSSEFSSAGRRFLQKLSGSFALLICCRYVFFFIC